MLNVPENIEKIINEFVNGVSEILGDRLKKVILYGSYARGDYNNSSDIDIMILTDLNGEELERYETEVWDYAYDIESNYDFSIHLSPIINNIEKYNIRTGFIPFYKNVQMEGVVLNG